MQLSTEDKERIEQEAKNARLGYSVVTKWFEAGAEYATIYERQKQAKEIERLNRLLVIKENKNDLDWLNALAEVNSELFNEKEALEAERTEVRNKVIDEVLLIVSEWGKQIDPNYIEGQQLFHKLNSLKTK